MNKRRFSYFALKLLLAAAIVLPAFVTLMAQPVLAGDLEKLDCSLKLIPADAAFYSSMLRNREQIEDLLQSNAWSKVMAMPTVQMAKTIFEMQAKEPGSRAAKGLAALENAETKKLIDLVADMCSNEIFCYGGENTVDFLELLQSILSATRYQPTVLQARGEAKKIPPDKLQAKILLETLADNVDHLGVPDIVAGFRLKKPAAASEALIKLEMFINIALEAQPALKGHFAKQAVGDHEYLVLNLDGKMIPWDQLPLDKAKALLDDENDWKALVEHVKKMHFVFAIGVRDNNLLVSIGSSLETLKRLGSGEKLIDRPEVVPLKEFSDKPLTSICYVSKELGRQINNNAGQIEDLREFLIELLPMAGLSERENEQIEEDAEKFVDDLRNMMPKQEASFGFSFLTSSGYEGYNYSWGENFDLDGSKPLGLLQHVGGNPMLGLVGRRKVSLERYDTIVKWYKKAYSHATKIILPHLPDQQRQKAKAVLKDLSPLLGRLNIAVRHSVLPALADGQFAFVIDAKLKSKRPHMALPPTEKELPIIEPALILGVSDAVLLQKGAGEILSVGDDLVELVKKYNPTALPPNFKLPKAKIMEQTGKKIYAYPLPETWGVDKKIVPNAAIADHVAVVTLSPLQSQRLLEPTPLKVGGALAKADKPLALAFWFDWSEVLGALNPWVQYFIEQTPPDKFGGQKELVVPQVQTILEVLGTIKSITSEVSMDKNCLVTHSILEIHDLEK
ncbi:MAG: hypothetical protein ACWGMZ_02915 [Thermoguttaceae bacterium]